MSAKRFSIKADFLSRQGRRLFYLLLQPANAKVRGSILYLPPFTEEMHKSRHIVASQARELAAEGFNVMLLDLTGCGDSGGEFSQADWQTWQADAMAGADRLACVDPVPLIVWGLRMGALLACGISRNREDVEKLVLWQPALNGEQQIDQFLRLETVRLDASGKPGFNRTALWGELRAGRSLEVAGYELSSAMALGIAKERLHDLNPARPVVWLEIASRENGGLSVASENVIARWRELGTQVESIAVPGDAFWRNAESLINPALQARTTEVLAR